MTAENTATNTRAIFDTLPNMTAGDVDRLVSARMSRQDTLFGEDRKTPRPWAVMEETALDRTVGSAEVMREPR